jgi:hypothetical protein
MCIMVHRKLLPSCVRLASCFLFTVYGIAHVKRDSHELGTATAKGCVRACNEFRSFLHWRCCSRHSGPQSPCLCLWGRGQGGVLEFLGGLCAAAAAIIHNALNLDRELFDQLCLMPHGCHCTTAASAAAAAAAPTDSASCSISSSAC